jgi:hypothetical protein
VKRKQAVSDVFDAIEAVVSPDSLSMVQFANITVDPAGGVHVIFFGVSEAQQCWLWHTHSIDGGVSFSPPRKITHLIFPGYSAGELMGQIEGLPGQRMYPCPQIAADLARPGNLYVTWTATGVLEKSSNGADIYFSRSTDFGVTWSTPAVINDDAKETGRDQFYSSIAVNSSGTLVITWYDLREDSENQSARYYYALSRDGGEHFLQNAPVANKPMDMLRCRCVFCSPICLVAPSRMHQRHCITAACTNRCFVSMVSLQEHTI